MRNGILYYKLHKSMRPAAGGVYTYYLYAGPQPGVWDHKIPLSWLTPGRKDSPDQLTLRSSKDKPMIASRLISMVKDQAVLAGYSSWVTKDKDTLKLLASSKG